MQILTSKIENMTEKEIEKYLLSLHCRIHEDAHQKAKEAEKQVVFCKLCNNSLSEYELKHGHTCAVPYSTPKTKEDIQGGEEWPDDYPISGWLLAKRGWNYDYNGPYTKGSLTISANGDNFSEDKWIVWKNGNLSEGGEREISTVRELNELEFGTGKQPQPSGKEPEAITQKTVNQKKIVECHLCGAKRLFEEMPFHNAAAHGSQFPNVVQKQPSGELKTEGEESLKHEMSLRRRYDNQKKEIADLKEQLVERDKDLNEFSLSKTEAWTKVISLQKQLEQKNIEGDNLQKLGQAIIDTKEKEIAELKEALSCALKNWDANFKEKITLKEQAIKYKYRIEKALYWLEGEPDEQGISHAVEHLKY